MSGGSEGLLVAALATRCVSLLALVGRSLGDALSNGFGAVVVSVVRESFHGTVAMVVVVIAVNRIAVPRVRQVWAVSVPVARISRSNGTTRLGSPVALDVGEANGVRRGEVVRVVC